MRTAEQLHKEHQEWIKEVGFYKDELVFLEQRIDDKSNNEMDQQQLALLKAYKSELLRAEDKLNKQLVLIEGSELDMKRKIQEGSIDPSLASIKEPIHQRKHIEDLFEKVEILKESLRALLVQ